MENKVVVLLKKDVSFKEVGVFLGKLTACFISETENFKEYHKELTKTPKNYTFSIFYEKSENGVFKRGEAYSFSIRTDNQNILNELKKAAIGYKNSECQVLMVEETDNDKNAKTYYSATPVILMRPRGSKEKYFTNNIDLEEYKRELIKKALSSYRITKELKEKIDYDFIEKVEFINEKVYGIRYKEATFLGRKIKITFKNDELSKKIKNFVIDNGLGEKTTVVGSGFLLPHKEVI